MAVTYRQDNDTLVAPALEVEQELGDVAQARRVLEEGDWSIIGTPDLSTPCEGCDPSFHRLYSSNQQLCARLLV